MAELTSTDAITAETITSTEPDAADQPAAVPAPTGATTDAEPTGPSATEMVLLLLLGLVWLAATLWTARTAIANNSGDPAAAASTAALALPDVVTAALLAGTAAALAVAGLAFASPESIARRTLVGAAAGAICGGVAGGLILFGYGNGPSIGVLAGTVVAAGLVGGASAVLRRAVHAAAVTGVLTVFLAGVAINVFEHPLKSLLGAGTSVASQAGAANQLSILSAVGSGAVAGLVAYFYLRRRRDLRWPAFALAGAFPGLLLLAAEAITTVGGSGLFAAVDQLSTADQATLNYVDGARLDQALTVTFIGAVVAMIAVGRTMRRVEDDEDLEDHEAQLA